MKMILACLSTLPLLSLSVSAESTSTPAAATVQSNKTVIKRGFSLEEAESILLHNALRLERYTMPVSNVIIVDPKDPIEGSIQLPEGKGGYFLRFEWDEAAQCHKLQDIWHSADLNALMEIKNSKAARKIDESFTPKKIGDINLSTKLLLLNTKSYKRALADEIEYAVEELSILRQTPNLGRVAHELFEATRYTYRDFEAFCYYEEYIEEELKILEQLADHRYDSKEEQEAHWQNAIKSQQELQRKYPRSAKSLPSLIEYAKSLHQSQAELTATQRVENYTTAHEQHEKELIKHGLDLGVRFEHMPDSVQKFARQYLCALLLAEATAFEEHEDLEKLNYRNVNDLIDILKKADLSTLPKEYRKAVENHIEELETLLLSAKDGKLPLDADFPPDFQQTVQKNINKAAEWVKNRLPSKSDDKQGITRLSKVESFRSYLDPSSLLHWIMEGDDLKDYYSYLLKKTGRLPLEKGDKKWNRISIINRAIAEKIKIQSSKMDS